METATSTYIIYPIKEILTDLAGLHKRRIRPFTQEYFRIEKDKFQFPLLNNLLRRLRFSEISEAEMIENKMIAFEAGSEERGLAYFSREVEEESEEVRECGLVNFGGRNIYLKLRGNKMGLIKIADERARVARRALGEESLLSSYDIRPNHEYNFMQELGSESLPGVRKFLEIMMGIRSD